MTAPPIPSNLNAALAHLAECLPEGSFLSIHVTKRTVDLSFIYGKENDRRRATFKVQPGLAPLDAITEARDYAMRVKGEAT